jgi:hypothetical protein
MVEPYVPVNHFKDREPLAKGPVPAQMRHFETGATRNTDTNKLDYEGFLSPLVLRSYAKYMSKNRIQADGTVRSSDNWQLGIPQDAYVKSLLRHVMDVWLIHDGHGAASPETGEAVSLEEALDAVMFNTIGLLYEVLKAKP